MTFNKKVLAGLVALAAASTANAKVVVGGDNGFEFSTDGEINQFYVHTDDKNGDDINEIRDGLLPAFLGFNIKAPTMNGLDIAARISFSPGTNQSSYDTFEQREVFFTVDGSFGQILAGKALGLYGSHNILTEQTLYGVGYGTGGNGGTTLGGIGLGYDYASWRSQIKWTSPDMNGFKIAFAIMDSAGGALRVAGGLPTGSLATGNGGEDSEDLRYEADLTYAGAFDGGNYMLWLSGMSQGDDVAGGDDRADDEKAYTVGGTLAVSGFEFMAQYSDAEGATAATAVSSSTDTGAIVVTPATASSKVEWDQYVVQGGYRFNGATLVSANYSELTEKTSGVGSDDSMERITLGVYHDVNANLKLVAEYTMIEHDDNSIAEQDIFALGGFVSW
jgi:porin-like protein